MTSRSDASKVQESTPAWLSVSTQFTSMSSEYILRLPETMSNWPWKRQINSSYKEVKAESEAWFHSFHAFTPESQHAFDKCDFSLLASLAYPMASKEHLRTGCDLMMLFFVIDEYTDVEDGETVRKMVEVVVDALSNPHNPRPSGEILLGEVARQFWASAIKTASASSQKHFLEAFIDYLHSVVAQAKDRDTKTSRTVDEYLALRRQNIGARPSYVPTELGLIIPDEAFYHPVIVELSTYIADLIIVDNDIASYNKEQATGDDLHNIITVIMHQFQIDTQSAMEWAAEYHSLVEAKFLDGLKRVPSWGKDVDKQMDAYILGLANWPRCNDCWNFESGRYFGGRGHEIQRTRLVPLLPRQQKRADMKRERVIVPLIEV